MIVRRRDGQLLLIRQTDHAVLAGDLARHWGNAGFAAPSPRDPVLFAAERHDDGWLIWEAAPRVDPATRRPHQFTSLPIAEHVGFYRTGIERVMARDSYAGLLTIMHLAGLYQMRYGTDRHTQPRTLPEDQERLKRRFVAELSEQQQALRQDLPRQGVPEAWLEEQCLWVNYKLLQVFDRLSLYLCVAPPRSSFLEPVPLDYEGRETQLSLRPLSERSVSIAPYPFDHSPFPVSVRAGVVPDREYDGDEDFRQAFVAAPVVELQFELRAG
jgi:hypothetical protein